MLHALSPEKSFEFALSFLLLCKIGTFLLNEKGFRANFDHGRPVSSRCLLKLQSQTHFRENTFSFASLAGGSTNRIVKSFDGSHTHSDRTFSQHTKLGTGYTESTDSADSILSPSSMPQTLFCFLHNFLHGGPRAQIKLLTRKFLEFTSSSQHAKAFGLWAFKFPPMGQHHANLQLPSTFASSDGVFTNFSLLLTFLIRHTTQSHS